MRARQRIGGRIASHRRATLVRAIVLALVAALALLLLADARSAAASGVDGVSDQNLGLWKGDFTTAAGLADPFPSYFQQGWVGGASAPHLRYARFVTAPDAIAQGGACEQNLLSWYTYVTQTLHMIPVIGVWQVAEGGCADDGVPSSAKYTTEIAQLLATLRATGATLPYLEAWNEPNSSGVSPSTAATFWSDAASVCAGAGCTALAGDFVDNDPNQGGQAFNPGCTANLSYSGAFKSYEASYVKALNGATPSIWALHPYYAVNCEQPASITTFAAGLPASVQAPQIWFTEVGSWECRLGQTTPRGTARQLADANYLNTLLRPPFPVLATNTFWYELAVLGWTQNCAKYADSALYEANQQLGPLLARPAAGAVFGPDTTLSATTASASGLSASGATLSGSVTPGGIYEATEYFEYGRTTAYTSQTAHVALGPGLSPQAVSASISGLSPGTLYHYKIVAVDTAGNISAGSDLTFVTPRH